MEALERGGNELFGRSPLGVVDGHQILRELLEEDETPDVVEKTTDVGQLGVDSDCAPLDLIEA